MPLSRPERGAAAQEYSLRNSPGLSPVAFLKLFVKYFKSEYPTRTQTSATDRAQTIWQATHNQLLARFMRTSDRYSKKFRPVSFLNSELKYDPLNPTILLTHSSVSGSA